MVLERSLVRVIIKRSIFIYNTSKKLRMINGVDQRVVWNVQNIIVYILGRVSSNYFKHMLRVNIIYFITWSEKNLKIICSTMGIQVSSLLINYVSYPFNININEAWPKLILVVLQWNTKILFPVISIKFNYFIIYED